jgi:hypothetical protein
VIEKARARCMMCGAPLDGAGECSSHRCRSNQDTIRPRHSQAQAVRKPIPSGAFAATPSRPSTLQDFLGSAGPDHRPAEMARIPAHAPLPTFSAEVLAESEYYGRSTPGDAPSDQDARTEPSEPPIPGR